LCKGKSCRQAEAALGLSPLASWALGLVFTSVPWGSARPTSYGGWKGQIDMSKGSFQAGMVAQVSNPALGRLRQRVTNSRLSWLHPETLAKKICFTSP
jgi:hypothetical protein